MGKCYPLVRGRIMRVTRLDACGRIARAAARPLPRRASSRLR